MKTLVIESWWIYPFGNSIFRKSDILFTRRRIVGDQLQIVHSTCNSTSLHPEFTRTPTPESVCST